MKRGNNGTIFTGLIVGVASVAFAIIPLMLVLVVGALLATIIL